MSLPRASDDRLTRRADLVHAAYVHSDMCVEALDHLASMFDMAHVGRARGGLSLEIGTRAGGSALLMLTMLQELYDHNPPLLLTVDPYGCKPYDPCDDVGYYGAAAYTSMRGLLAKYENHAHYYMASEEFLSRIPGSSYWHHALKRIVGNFTFVLLDGDHTPDGVRQDLSGVWPHVALGGVVLIDNANKALLDGLPLPPDSVALDPKWLSDGDVQFVLMKT